MKKRPYPGFSNTFKSLPGNFDPYEFEKKVKVLHVIGPLGGSTCPQCGGEGEKRGSWDYGPFYWQCEDCDHQWGHA